MDYPGRVIKQGDSDKAVVRAIQVRLNEVGCGPLDAKGLFGPRTKASVRLFQARNVDAEGRPLVQDGKVGSLTWAALFGQNAVPAVTEASTPFLRAVLKTAEGQLRVREQPKNSNSGPEVDAYLTRAGVPLSLPAVKKPWCCAFVYWCFDEAAKKLGHSNVMVKTAGCLDHWNRASAQGATRVTARAATDDPSLVSPGMVFIMDYGEGRGHTGFVVSVAGGILHTIEGNTDASRTREGGGVYRLVRKVGEINKGYIHYGAA